MANDTPHPVRVFVDVRDPWARRMLRDALARERDVRFVSSASAADVIVGDRDTGGRRRAVPAGDATPGDGVPPNDAPDRAEPSAGRGALTDRERAVLQALAEGASNVDIAERLGVSRSTVKFHIAALYEKLGVHRRGEAVAAGVRRGEVLL